MIQSENFPLVVVTCYNHWPMLQLQAQSMQQHLLYPTNIYVIVNEKDPTAWTVKFDKHIRHLYDGHNLTVLYHDDFDFQTASGKRDKWGGWDDQQILKLAIAEKLDAMAYLVLDTQNFLIKSWDPNNYKIINNKIPYRTGVFVMPKQTWDSYKTVLELDIPDPNDATMAICTPIFLRTDLIKQLIASKGGLQNFSMWFHSMPGMKSEFILYLQYAESQGGFHKTHYKTGSWGNPYLRDSENFSSEVIKYFAELGKFPRDKWTSINHRAWQDLDDSQCEQLTTALQSYSLTPMVELLRNRF